MHAHAIGCEFLFWLVTKNLQRKVLQVGKSQIWKTNLWTKKKSEKLMFEISIWVKKLQFFFKYVFAPDRVIFFLWLQPNDAKIRVL